jgi:hypothetical protein
MADDDEQTVDVVVPPELEVGIYANFAAVSSQGPHDITLDFIQMVPGAGVPKPIVVSRLKLSPSFLMPLMQALSNHLNQHEAIVRQVEGQPPTEPKDEEDES